MAKRGSRVSGKEPLLSLHDFSLRICPALAIIRPQNSGKNSRSADLKLRTFLAEGEGSSTKFNVKVKKYLIVLVEI